MRFTLADTPPEQAACDLLALPVPDPGTLQGEVADVDRAAGGRLAEVARAEGFSGKPNRTVLLQSLDRPARRVLLVGIGADPTAERLRRYAGVAIRRAREMHAGRVALGATPWAAAGPIPPEEQVRAVAEGAGLGSYTFDRYRKGEDGGEVTEVALLARHGDRALLLRGQQAAEVAIRATSRARDLVNEPANVLTPTALAEIAQEIAGSAGLTCRVFDLDEARTMGMGLFAAVAQGSAQPPKFIVMDYRPPGARRTVALAGKGITFDSGGLSIKTAGGMMTMKGDMAGAAAVVATMGAVRDVGVSVRVLGLVPATENMISGAATRPGDIVRGLGGKTVEITNTDAEGRLVLADALAYAVREGADEVIDLATLTGSCVVALGDWTAGLMGNNQPLMDRILEAAALAGEQVWQLPLYEEFLDAMRGEITDLKNSTTGRAGGAERAAAFLGEFVGATPWAHLDIAGPAFAETRPPAAYWPSGGTGFGVRTLLRYVASLK
ncbi:MAG: leucyl aminopeptidase [Bacillati bacterium ANGP1]|uniref:Probable cytosol aminopeptidase n=1 Tax=Candidatus Segetimicrobium genomatis TaxID=2569760 RepID=A0A537K1Q3_9BACT|nr:MAG: leucyl aminopeptidase [Terrabacteria group bacterium ANGP1]